MTVTSPYRFLRSPSDEEPLDGTELVSERFLADPEAFQRYIAKSAAEAIDVYYSRQQHNPKASKEPFWPYF